MSLYMNMPFFFVFFSIEFKFKRKFFSILNYFNINFSSTITNVVRKSTRSIFISICPFVTQFFKCSIKFILILNFKFLRILNMYLILIKFTLSLFILTSVPISWIFLRRNFSWSISFFIVVLKKCNNAWYSSSYLIWRKSSLRELNSLICLFFIFF